MRSPQGCFPWVPANQTTSQTINFTVVDTGFPAAVTIAAGVSRGGWDHPNPSLAQFGVVYFDEISAYSTSGRQPFPLGNDAVTMVDENGTTLARPDMLTDYTVKAIFVGASWRSACRGNTITSLQAVIGSGHYCRSSHNSPARLSIQSRKGVSRPAVLVSVAFLVCPQVWLVICGVNIRP
jgi:hypothetical protein